MKTLADELHALISEARSDVARCSAAELPMASAYWLAEAERVAREKGFGKAQSDRAKSAIEGAIAQRKSRLEQEGQAAS